ncbi:MAG: bifunctional diaminohydroxyphosphoribosylaminopyrimidine deaminase/5-amino-6-(5-phosphoribosylamino)uracil reductase RibD [Actinomycetes bacterium]
MRRAVVLAARGEPATKPNPSVGCVVLDAAGEVAGEGWHAAVGGPHAEVVALTAAAERARGGTVVVTLEPCAHTGRTPPCVDALLEAGVGRVVYAVPDPTGLAGGGAGRLRTAGVDVEGGVLGREAERVNARWLTCSRELRPYTTWKYAASLDGRVAAADGTSRWISGATARAEVHRMRAAHDCIVVGVGTVLADDPQLTARLPDGSPAETQPLRVVVDSSGRTPPRARVRDEAAPTWVVTTADVGAGPDGRVDLGALMRALAAKGHQDAFVEGGPTLAGALVASGLVDRVVAYVAPLLLGAGPPALGPAGVRTLPDALRLDLDEVGRLGDDVRLVGRPYTARED